MLIIVERTPSCVKTVKEMRFKYKDNNTFSYVFELKGDTPILATRTAMENYYQCVVKVNTGLMVMEVVERNVKCSAKTIAVCPECGHKIEKNNNGMTLCPYCCSLYGRNNIEIYMWGDKNGK